MATVLVTGASGILGRQVALSALSEDHEVHALSRSGSAPEGVASFQGDVVTGSGLEGACQDLDAVVHCAASPFRKARATEVDGLLNLVHAAPDARHIYPSIVGVDRIPFSYYRVKLAAEEALAASGAEHVIQRLTQFHEFADRIAAAPVPLVPRHMRVQSIAAVDAADILVGFIGGRAKGRVADAGGPEVHDLRTQVRQRLRLEGRRRPVVAVPMGGFSKALRQGRNLCPQGAVGKVSWAEHLQT